MAHCQVQNLQILQCDGLRWQVVLKALYTHGELTQVIFNSFLSQDDAVKQY